MNRAKIGYVVFGVLCLLIGLSFCFVVMLGIENREISQQHKESMDRIAVIEDELIQLNTAIQSQ